MTQVSPLDKLACLGQASSCQAVTQDLILPRVLPSRDLGSELLCVCEGRVRQLLPVAGFHLGVQSIRLGIPAYCPGRRWQGRPFGRHKSVKDRGQKVQFLGCQKPCLPACLPTRLK